MGGLHLRGDNGALLWGEPLWGIGTVIGSVFGVLTIKVLENCINLLNVSYYTYQAFQDRYFTRHHLRKR